MRKVILFLGGALAINAWGGCSSPSSGSDGGPTCGPGTTLVGNQCIAPEASTVICGAGTVLAGGQCVAVEAGAPVTVVVNIVGPGAGSVSGAGVTCVGNVCSAAVAAGTPVQLTATPSAGYIFAGWRGGGCTGTGMCQVTPSADTVIKAGFAAATFWVNSDILAAPLTGGSGSPVASGNGNFAVSADGMTFAYPVGYSPRATWVLDYWSGQTTMVESKTVWPSPFAGSFSPDGTSIALWVTTGGFTNLETVHTDGTKVTPITAASGNFLVNYDCYSASCASTRFVGWSPDGTQIAWISTAPISDAGTTYGNLWISHADGTNVTNLTSFTSANMTADPRLAGPDWSPDGTKIAFVSTMPDGDAGAPVSNLWTITVGTKALSDVTKFTTEYSLDIPTYTRTGNTLVFSSLKDPAGSGAITSRNLFSVKDDGTALTALTTWTSGSFNGGQYWTSDGATLVYESNQSPTVAGQTTPSSYTIWGVKPGSAPAAITTPVNGVYDYSPLEDND